MTLKLPKATLTLLIPLSILIGCKKDDPASATPAASVAINGTATSITSPTATAAFGNEVAINLTAGSYAIAAYLSDKTAGTYTVQKGTLGGRATATQTAFISVVDGQLTYAGVSGSLTISVDVQGRLSGTFSFTASAGGKTLNVTNGSFSGVSITTISGGQCFFNFNGVPFSSSQGFAYCVPNYVIGNITASVAVGAGNSTATNTWLVYVGLSDGAPIIEFIPNSGSVAGSLYINADPSGSSFNGSVVKVGNTYTFSGRMYDYTKPNSSPASISGVISCK